MPDDREVSPDAQRLIADIESAAERLKRTIDPPADDPEEPVAEEPRRGFFSRLFGRG